MTGVDSERFLIDDWGDLDGYTFSEDKTLALAMSSTVEPWRGENSMFTQGFVPATSPWVGISSAQSSAEGMGTAGTTLCLTESAIFVDRFVPTQQCLALSFASGIHPSKIDGAYQPR